MTTHGLAVAFALPAGIAMLMAGTAMAEAPNVVASIKPVHSLVSAVMAGVGQPELIVKGAASPHTYSMKPSDAAALEQANVVFWVGEALEPFLEKPVETLGGGAKVVELSAAPGLLTLPYREGGPFERDEHEGEEHGDHAGGEDHGSHAEEGSHTEEAGHEHAGEAAQAAEGSGHQHAHDGIDMHFWLDPQNAKAMIAEIVKTLAAADPENAARYASNAAAAVSRIDALQAEIEATLAPVKGKPFIVFHDAYQYFEKRFGLNAAGSITVSPENAPGAQRVSEIREKVERLGAVCVFAEPQFEPRIVQTVLEGTEARSGVLDPEGAAIPDGPDLYPTLLRDLAKSLRDCLSGES